MSGTHGITFALYADREGGSPLWLESHNVTFDEQGHYSVLLGANSERGIVPELFAAGEPRWLGVHLQLPGWQEEPRVLLVSVPYALKALDAETLGGRPASAYVLAESRLAGTTDHNIHSISAAALPAGQPHYAQSSDYLVKYNGAGYEASKIYQTTTDRVGVRTTAPGTYFEVNLSANDGTFASPHAIRFWDGSNGWQIGETSNAFFQLWRVTANTLSGPFLTVNTAGMVGIGTTSPLLALDVRSTGVPARFETTSGGDTVYLEVAKTGAVGDSSNVVWLLPTQNQSRFGVAAMRALTETVDATTVAAGMEFWTGSSATGTAPRLRIDRTGNVAIGTNGVISYKLDVAGTINAAGIRFPDGTTQTTACNTFSFLRTSAMGRSINPFAAISEAEWRTGPSSGCGLSTDETNFLRQLVGQQQTEIRELQAELAELRAAVNRLLAAVGR